MLLRQDNSQRCQPLAPRLEPSPEPDRGPQALNGGLLDAKDITGGVQTFCQLVAGFVPSSYCPLNATSGFYYTAPGDSLRVSWSCICGAGDAPTVDPITGACTPCPAGAKAFERTGRGQFQGREAQECRDGGDFQEEFQGRSPESRASGLSLGAGRHALCRSTAYRSNHLIFHLSMLSLP